MFSFKKFMVYVVAVFLAVPVAFAQGEFVTRDSSGGYSYETTISSLVQRRVFEEIKLINNSSFEVTNVTCVVTINGKTHDMRPISVLKPGESEGFDGYFEDDMKREFPKCFGQDGKFLKENNSVVKFSFNFKGHNDDVVITDVYDSEDDLCFIVNDALVDAVINNGYVQKQYVVQVPIPIETVSQPAPYDQTQTLQSGLLTNDDGDTVVVIDGESYLLHNGKAFPIQK